MKLKTLLVLVLVLATPVFAVPRASSAPKAAAAAAPKVDTDLQNLINKGGTVGGFTTFRAGVSHASALRQVKQLGLHVGVNLPATNSVYAYGPATGFAKLASSSNVVRLQIDRKLPTLSHTGTWATRARELNTQTGGLDMRVKDSSGRYIDGTGVGIAIVDSGIDALHKDLQWCQSPGAFQSTCKTRVNYKMRCTTPVLINVNTGECFGPVPMQDVPDSDTTAGHGTHVSGIAAGSGAMSAGTVKTDTPYIQGVAPGAKLYGFGVGDGDSIDVLGAAAAFQWIIDHGANRSPAIKVINNSYGNPGPNDGTDILTMLSNAAIAKGITVVWAAGNSGATSTGTCNDSVDPGVPCTSVNANNRTPGNLSVANYDDASTGTRDNALSSDSSQGIPGHPETYPLFAAPGSNISSTCQPYITFCSAYGSFALPEPAFFPKYSMLSGTSMASPHVTGVVALLYQANPSITPAQVQQILEDTAHRFTSGAAYEPEPANPSSPTSVDKGHGLVDAHAAVLAAEGLPADTGLNVTPASTVTTIANDDGGDQSTDSLDLVSARVADDAANNQVDVSWTVHSLNKKPQSLPFRYQLNASVDGTRRVLSVDWTGHAVTCTQDLADHCTASLSGNTFTAAYDAGAFGAVTGAPIFDMWASTYGGLVYSQGLPCTGASVIGLVDIPAPCMSDRAPGTDGEAPAGVEAHIAPERGPAHVFTFTGNASGACSDPNAPQVTDAQGDATQLFVDAGLPLPSEPTLDITTGKLTWDAASRTVVFHIGVPGLTASPPTGADGKLFRFDFDYAGETFELQAQSDDVQHTESYSLDTVRPSGVQETEVTTVSGAFDVANKEVRINLPLDTFNSGVAALFAAQTPPLTPPATLDVGAALGSFSILGQRVEGVVTPTADQAVGTCGYTVGS